MQSEVFNLPHAVEETITAKYFQKLEAINATSIPLIHSTSSNNKNLEILKFLMDCGKVNSEIVINNTDGEWFNLDDAIFNKPTTLIIANAVRGITYGSNCKNIKNLICFNSKIDLNCWHVDFKNIYNILI